MDDLKQVLHWTLAETAAIKKRLAASRAEKLGERIDAYETALIDVSKLVEELARHIDLLERQAEPWLPGGNAA